MLAPSGESEKLYKSRKQASKAGPFDRGLSYIIIHHTWAG